MTATRVPVSSIAIQVVLFFARNPHEVLLPEDIRVKFGCAPGQAHNALRRVIKAGLLGTTHLPAAKTGSRALRGICAGPAMLRMIDPRTDAAPATQNHDTAAQAA